MHFEMESMLEILHVLKKRLLDQSSVGFEVLNPDVSPTLYAGEVYEVDGKSYLYHGYKAWNDLAQLLGCKMLTPQVRSDHTVWLQYKKYENDASFHTSVIASKEEKYGLDSAFSAIHKNEEPMFVYHYEQALKIATIKERQSVLNLGINRGDEFDVIQSLLSDEAFEQITLVGVDHSRSAIDFAKQRYPAQTFYQQDINALDDLNLGRFDLIVSIGTLQSPSIDFKLLFNKLIQNYLNEGGAIILGFPNSRWISGEMVYGAKMPNYSESDLSLLIKDIYYCKKYLQQKKFKVRLTGRDYIFLTASKRSLKSSKK